jgi:hypothetical protein
MESSWRYAASNDHYIHPPLQLRGEKAYHGANASDVAVNTDQPAKSRARIMFVLCRQHSPLKIWLPGLYRHRLLLSVVAVTRSSRLTLSALAVSSISIRIRRAPRMMGLI